MGHKHTLSQHGPLAAPAAHARWLHIPHACSALHALTTLPPSPPLPIHYPTPQEQEEVQRLREQLELMTAERDRLLAELQQGGDASFFVLDRASMDIQYRQRQAAAAEHQRAEAAPAALHRTPPPAGRTAAEALAGGQAAAPQPPRPRSGLRTMFGLP